MERTTEKKTSWDIMMEQLKAKAEEEAKKPQPERKSVCPYCGGSGYQEEIRESNGIKYEYARPCVCLTAEWNAKRLEGSGLLTAEAQTFESFQASEPWQAKILEAAKAYVADTRDNPTPWFYIAGQPGAGKSHICTAICAELVKRGLSCRYEVWRDLAARLKAEQNTADYRQTMDGLASVGVLYIDDLFKGGHSAADDNLLWEVVSRRYNANKRTVFSSEWYLSQIIDNDHATGGRIHERARGYVQQLRLDENRDWRINHAGSSRDEAAASSRS